MNVDVQYGVLHYATGVYDLCDKFKEASLPCPVSKGKKQGVFQGRVPFPHVRKSPSYNCYHDDNCRDISSLLSMLQLLLVTKFHALLLNLMTIINGCVYSCYNLSIF